MKEIINCYRNWRLDFIVLFALIAILLGCDESESYATRLMSLAIILIDAALAYAWRKAGKLSELDDIKE